MAADESVGGLVVDVPDMVARHLIEVGLATPAAEEDGGDA